MKSDDKQRPKEERLARMEGSTTFRDPRDGFARGSIDLSDTEVMGAVAMVRALLPNGEPDQTDIGPECLETYYGSTQRHRRTLVTTYMRLHSVPNESTTRKVVRRMATTLAAQLLAGAQFDRWQWSEFAFITCTRRETLEKDARDALGWFHSETSRALDVLIEVLNTNAPTWRAEKAAAWRRMRDAPNRAARIAAKLR